MNKVTKEIFFTNKSSAALCKDDEMKVVKDGGPLPVDIRATPRDGWDALLHRHVTLPDGVKEWIAGHCGEPFTTEEVHGMEIAVEKFHGIAAPYYIHMDSHLATTGRAWLFVPAAAQFQTGFVLGKE